MDFGTRAKAALVCVTDFCKSKNLPEPDDLTLLRSREDLRANRQVYRLTIGSETFVLKYSREVEGKGELSREFENTKLLYEMMGAKRAARPVHINQDIPYIVTTFMPGQTMFKLLENAKTASQAEGYWRQAGSWLAEFHAHTKEAAVPFYPRQFIRSAQAKIDKNLGGHLWDDIPINEYMKILRQDRKSLMDATQLPVMVHGDFHAGNLMMDGSTTSAIDCSNFHDKFAYTDISSIFILDDYRADSIDDSFNNLGLTQSYQDAFFDGYGTGEPDKITRYVLRAKLLSTFLGLTEEIQSETKCRLVYSRLRTRLEAAFS